MNIIDANSLAVDEELGNFQISGTGVIEIRNTGGSSASEGGMGTGNGDAEKGQDTGQQLTEDIDAEEDTSWDPLKPKEEKQKSKE